MADEATTVAAHSDDNNMDGSMNSDNNDDYDTSSPPRQKQRVTFEEGCENKRNNEGKNEQTQHADGNNTKEELEQTQQPTVQLAVAPTQQQVAHHQHHSKKKPLSLGGVSKRAVLSSKRKVSIFVLDRKKNHLQRIFVPTRLIISKLPSDPHFFVSNLFFFSNRFGTPTTPPSMPLNQLSITGRTSTRRCAPS